MLTETWTASSPAFALPATLDTPSVVVDIDRLDANITRMQRRASAAGVRLRPHAKTHKCSAIAHRQLLAGAVGVTVATVREAASFATAGIEDLFIAYPVWSGGAQGRALRALHERVELRVGVDSRDGAAALATATAGAGRAVKVLLELDCGQHRSGIDPEGAAQLATQCLELGLDVVGAFTHPGHAYASREAVAAAACDEQAALQVAAAGLSPLLTRPPELSGGSTPTANTGEYGVMTEIRPGTYVFGDAQQMALVDLDPGCVALAVAARIVSRPRSGEAVLDAGSKTLSSDRPAWLDGHGWLPAAPDARLATLSEEHAVVRGLDDDVEVGQVLAVVPNHVCTAVNLAHELTVVREGTVLGRWPIDAGVR